MALLRVDGPEVAQQPAPNATLSVAGGDAAAFGGNQARLLGEAAVIAQRISDRNDIDQVFRAETALKTDYLAFERDELGRQGAGVKGAAERTKDWWQKAGQQYAAELTPRQRSIFEHRAAQVRLSGTETLMRHEQTQLNKSLVASAGAAAQTSIDMAIADPSPERIADAQKTIAASTVSAGQVLGMTPEEQKLTALKYTTQLHVKIIDQLALKSPEDARRYYKENKGQIEPDNYARVEKHLDTAGMAQTSQVEGSKLAGKYGPGETTAALKEIDGMTQYSADQKAGIRADLEHRHSIAVADQNQLHASSTRAVMSAYANGATLAQLQKLPAWRTLQDGGAAIKDHVLDRQHALAVRGDADRARAMRKLGEKNFAAYAAYSDPSTVQAMSRDQIAALLPSIGPELTQNLLNKKDSFAKSAAVYHEATIDKQMFDSLAARAGLSPHESGKSDREKSELSQLQALVEARIDKEQIAKGRVLTRDEKAALFQEEIDNKVLVESWWGLSTDAKPAYAVKQGDKVVTQAEKKAAAPAATPPKPRVPAAVISGPDRSLITQALRAEGLPVTEETIQARYALKHGR